MIKFVIIFIFILFISYIFLYDTNINDINEKNNTLSTSKNIYKENQIPLDSSTKRNEIINELSEYINTTSDISTINEDIIMQVGTLTTISNQIEKVPGEDLQNISIDDIMEDSSLSSEEKSRLIDDKAYFKVFNDSTPSVQISESDMIKMLEEDEYLQSQQ